MKILFECERFQMMAGLSNRELNGKWMSKALTRFITISLLFGCAGSHLVNCINAYTIDLQTMLFPVHCIAIVVAKLGTYIALLAKVEQMVELIGYLQMVVDERKWFDRF